MAATPVPTSPAPEFADGGSADKLFWLSRVEGDVPRASIVPDFRRRPGPRHEYRSLAFELDPEVIRALKSPDVTQGVSDVVLCISLVAVLLAHYHRDDELIIGVQLDDAEAGAKALVPLRIPAARDATMMSIMRAVARELAEIGGHALSSLAHVRQLIDEDIEERRYPFFDIGVAIGGADANVDFGAYPLDVAFAFECGGGHVRGRLMYAAELYEESSIERAVSHFLGAARQASEHPQRPLRELRVLSPGERSRILNGFQGAPVDFPLDKTFHALFEEQVRRTPAAVAAIYRDTELTYAELNERSNRLAHTLLSLGLTKGGFVGILLNRSCDFLTAMLGVFKAGGAYVPVDVTYPRERLRYMLDDSEAQFVVTNAGLGERLSNVIVDAHNVRVVLSLEAILEPAALAAANGRITIVDPARIESAPSHDPAVSVDGADRAYMIYTSGSSGRPKGAICRHNGALNHLFGELRGIGISSAFNFMQTAAASSDISVWQFMAPLLFGGATVIVDYEDVIDPVRLFAVIQEHRITVAEPVPVILRGLLDHIAGLPQHLRSLPDLRCMMCTGEALASDLVDRWLAHYPDIPIANTYGPTETSDDVTLSIIAQPIGERWAVAPIGRALPNVKLFVLDGDLHPVPVGVPGEICVAGIAVGEGYWRQPEKTRDAFVACPFPDVSQGLMYRTGDLGRWLNDGSIEFLGRIDQQVKVRGFRVEPGEIEGTMTKHPAVQDAAVVAVDDAGGNKRLIGYFVTHKGEILTTLELRQFLKRTLAEHMVPAMLSPLGALPLTPLGKVDRKALSRINSSEEIESENFVAPRTATEATIASAWARVLGQRKVGVLDNFFEIGGDSISTLHVIDELEKAGLRASPKQFFLYPTIAEFASHVVADQAVASSPIGAHAAAHGGDHQWPQLRQQLLASFPDLADAYPLGATQRGIYFQSILAAKTSGAYVEQIAFDIEGDLDDDVFGMAWQHVVNTTDVLRTAIVRRGVPQPAQVVLHSAALVPDRLDWRPMPTLEQERALEQLLNKERMRGFDLKTPPLMRLAFIRRADRRWTVAWTYHHIILDGWSEPLVLRAAFETYDALMGRQELPAAPAARFRDFVGWAESQDMTAAERFWRESLAGFEAPVSIKDASPAIQPPSNAETSHGSHEHSIAEVDTRRLEEAARRNRLTSSTLIHGAWALLLHRRTGREDVVFGGVVSGRQCNCPGVEHIRGPLVVTQPLRTRLVADATASSWLRLVQLQMAEMREYEQTPLASIQQWCEPVIGKRPLFDSIVVVGNYAGSDLTKCATTGLEISNVSYVTQPLYALTLFLVTGPRLSVRLVYDKRRYAPATARQLVDEYVDLLSAIAENPEQRLAGLVKPTAG